MALKMSNGIQIQNLEMLHNYFDFNAIYQILMNDPKQIEWFLEGLPKEEQNQIVLDLNALMKHMPKAKEYIEVTNEAKGKLWLIKDDRVALQSELFVRQMQLLYQTDMRFFESKAGISITDKTKDGFPTIQSYGENLVKYVQRITNNGMRLFTYEEAVKFLFFMKMYLLAGIFEISEDSMEFFLQEVLTDEVQETVSLKEKDTIIPAKKQEVLTLPFYTGKSAQEEPITFLKIQNDFNTPKTVRLEGTIIERVIPAKSVLWALQKGEFVIGFLPRFIVTNETVLHMEPNRLMFETVEGKSMHIEVSDNVVCWAHSNRIGSFLINENGKLDRANLYERILIQKKPIRKVVATNLDYGILFEDGNIVSGIKKKNWNNIIDFVLTTNHSFAITANRELIDKNGNTLGTNVAYVDAYEEHYLCFDANGTIHTDSGLKLENDKKVEKKCLTGAVCKKGYVISVDNAIEVYNFRNECVKRTEMPIKVTELFANGETVAYYDDIAKCFQFYPI